MPKKMQMYRWKMHRMGSIQYGIVSATTKTVAMKKLKRRGKIYRNHKISLSKT